MLGVPKLQQDEAELLQTLKKDLQDAFTQNVPLAFMMCEIDHLNEISECFGKPATDIALRFTAEKIFETISHVHKIFPYGNNTFCVILNKTQLNGAMRYAERICKQTYQSADKSNPTISNLSLSIGVTQLEHKDSPEALIARAQSALYLAKRAGGNRVLADKLLMIKHTRA